MYLVIFNGTFYMHIYLGLTTIVGKFLRVKIFRIVKILCANKEIP